jgi:poly(hydroxyalkanoate) depolymerase family esterase
MDHERKRRAHPMKHKKHITRAEWLVPKWVAGTAKLAKVDSRAWLNLSSARMRECAQDLWGPWMATPRVEGGRLVELVGQCESTGCQRKGRFFIPDSAKEHAPLVVMLHGCFQDSESLARLTRMDQLARERGFCVLYPQQSERAHPLRAWGWNKGENQARSAEPAALADMVGKAARMCGATPGMVSVAGISAGGAMAASLASLYPEIMGAAALVAAPMPYADRTTDEALEEMARGPSPGVKAAAELAARAASKRAGAPDRLPMLVVHGLEDHVVASAHAMGHERAFLSLNEALGDADGPAVPSQSDTPEGLARLWRSSEGSVLGALLAPSRLGHAWSGGDAAEPFSQSGFDQSRVLIDFFEAARSGEWDLFEPEAAASRLWPKIQVSAKRAMR